MVKITRWNPVREAMSLRQAMDRLFEDSFVRSDWAGFSGQRDEAYLPIDAYSTDEAIVVTASVPGVRPDDVEITVEGDSLTIRGEIPAPQADMDYIYAERSHGAFSRMLQLNIPVDVEKIEATFENGVLTLVLPKSEEVRPKVIKVKAK